MSGYIEPGLFQKLKQYFCTKKLTEFQNEPFKIFPFLKIQLMSEYSNKNLSALTATFANSVTKSIEDLSRMTAEELRDLRFFNLKDERRVYENELTFESLFQVKIT